MMGKKFGRLWLYMPLDFYAEEMSPFDHIVTGKKKTLVLLNFTPNGIKGVSKNDAKSSTPVIRRIRL